MHQSQQEKTLNICLGLSALSWAVLGLVHGEPEGRFTTVRLCLTALHLLAGCLFIVRQPLVRDLRPRDLLICLPSFVLSGLAFRLSNSPVAWPVHAQILFAVGSMIAAISLTYLGRSFALLPAFRSVKSSGPYALVRHPTYAGEVLMLVACGLSLPAKWELWAAIGCAIAFLVFRILKEEQLLTQFPAYQTYSQTVSYRLLPFVW